jgi:hypothetical protein
MKAMPWKKAIILKALVSLLIPSCSTITIVRRQTILAEIYTEVYIELEMNRKANNSGTK